jgi:hypothetical protein
MQMKVIAAELGMAGSCVLGAFVWASTLLGN